MLQSQINISYADMRSDKSKAGDLFVIQVDKPRLDNVPRLQPIDVEVDAVEVEKDFDADKFINTSVSIFTIFSILAVVFGCFYLHPITSTIVVLIGSISALFINRAVRLHEYRVAKKQRDT